VNVSCPKCGEPLEDYDSHEGGWCPRCGEWFPPDIVRERMEEEELPDGEEEVL